MAKDGQHHNEGVKATKPRRNEMSRRSLDQAAAELGDDGLTVSTQGARG